MKKLFVVCCLGAMLALSAGATQAAATETETNPGGIGIYVTPKVVWGNTIFDRVKGEAHIVSGDTEIGGVSSKSRKDDDSWGGAIAVGYDFERMLGAPIRGEIEYAFFGNVSGGTSKSLGDWGVAGKGKIKNKMDIQTLFFNGYFDIKTDTPFTPYIGGGLGIAFVDSKSSGSVDYTLDGAELSGSSSTNYKLNTNFAWNVGAGVAWEFADWVALDVGYRFAGLGKVKSRTSDYEGLTETVTYKSKVSDVYMHQILAGLRFTF